MTKRTDPPFQHQAVEDVFTGYAPAVRAALLVLRALIFDTASKTAGVGQVEETLKWGQPSYLTPATGSGSIIRLDRLKGDDRGYALYFHCQTGLVDLFRTQYGDLLHFEGNRSLHFSIDDTLPTEAVRHCIAQALTYHLNRRKKSRSHKQAIPQVRQSRCE